MKIDQLKTALNRATSHQFSLQHPDGYWWYTLEATDYICAEAVFLMHFMGEVDPDTEAGLARRILSTQRKDGTWALYHNAKPDISTTIECYWALKLIKQRHKSSDLTESIDKALGRARDFILTSGGITHARVFTKLHLALFGLVPWTACPAMPIELMLMPTWAPINVYEFSSWARACIIPLLVIMQKREARPLKDFNLDELFAEPSDKRDWSYKSDKAFLSWERFFIKLNKVLHLTTKFPSGPFGATALKKCEEWIVEHISRTEDIFPALTYGAMALSVMGHPNSHPIIRKALNALKSFRQLYLGNELPADANSCVIASPEVAKQSPAHSATIHQQCCISPVWDTPWQITALLESGVSPDDPRLLKAGRWLISKQVTHAYGDWKFKNNNVEPGGWSFEFENDFFPDVDDTIQVLHVLKRLAIPDGEKSESISRGLKWLVSMQNDDGGWAAFDRNNRRELVNKIPFSDHGACLDPSTPDVTARAVALLSEFIQIPSPIKNVIPAKAGIHSAISRGLDYLSSTQEDFGGWFGRWGVNYIYGTWCVLTALSKVAQVPSGWNARISKAAGWLMSIQHADGGFSESPESYKTNKYLPYPRPDKADKGVPSQTAWALMGLMAARLCHCESAKADEAISRGTEFLIKNLRNDGTWDEKEFTGTGFPNHFYIRYHGYRHFFPLLALGKLYHSQVLVIPAQAGI